MAQIVKRISAPYKIISANSSIPVSFTLGSGSNSANLIINGTVTTTDLGITGNITISGNSSVGNVSSASGNFTSLTATQFSTGNAQITGGAINNTIIGAITPAVGRFTTLTTTNDLIATGNIIAANFSGNTSGTNTGDQTITLIGNVTGSGTGSFNTTIASTGVVAGFYTLANITISSDGRITSAANGSAGSGSISALNGDVYASGSGNVTATLATVNSNTGTFGNATYIPTITVNNKGLVTAASQTSVSIPSGSISVTGTDITMSGSTGTAITNATLANTTVVPGFYTLANITIDSKGRITSAANGVGGSVGTITALNGDVYASGTGNVTATLVNTTVAAGSYSYANITVDSKGRLTSAVSGSLPSSGYDPTNVSITGGTISTTGNITANNFNLNSSGVIKFGDNTTQSTASTSYSLPIASNVTLGGIKVGAGLSVNATGVVSTTVVVQTQTYASTINANVSGSSLIDITLTGSPTTINFSGAFDGQPITLRLRQDAVGSRTVTFGTMFRYSADLTSISLSSIPYSLDYVSVRYTLADNRYDLLAFNRGFLA